MDVDEADPRRWLGDTPVLNLRDDKLRLRVKTVTQFSRNDAERLRSICNYVASIPFDVPPLGKMKMTRQTLARRHPVGWYSKAALFQAMLRVAGFPARVRMIRVDAAMYRGLAGDYGAFALPIVEVWTSERWIATDSYVYDPPYLATAREAVQRRGWRSGYGVHLDGKTDWDGTSDALVMIAPGAGQFLGVYDDPQAFADQVRSGSLLQSWRMRMRNRLMSIRIHRAVRQLRREAGG
jgi:hypothetical protein